VATKTLAISTTNLSCLSLQEHPKMAPSLEENTQVDLSLPMKAAPKLVAPEPGDNILNKLSLLNTC
jgi:hypothetical protein